MAKDIYGEAPSSIRIVDDEISYELHNKTVRAIAEIALRSGVGVPDAIQQSVANEKFLMDLEADGWELLIELPNGRIHHLDRI